MPKKLRAERKGFQVWRNPQGAGDLVRYLGEFHPPAGCDALSSNDLRDLGLGPGSYTVVAPSEVPSSLQFRHWKTIVVFE
jgi:hypothetical protein